MDQLVQCPVCTLFLHNGMSLESHLDTHPKDQVIKALCNLSKNSNYGSRTPTPMHSERSYSRSRSRTPAMEDNMRWNTSRNGDSERYWRRTPSRTPKPSRVATPSSEVRLNDMNFDNNSVNMSQYEGSTYTVKSDKCHQLYNQNSSVNEFDQPYVYYQDQQEDREIKYSRSAEYSAFDNSNNVFTYNMQSMNPAVKVPPNLVPTVSRRSNELVKLVPKPNNILVKTNVGGMQYIPPGVKPMHVMVPSTPTFIQKNVQNNMIIPGSVPPSPMLDTKTMPQPLGNQFNQMSSNNFTPGTTVVTQNSQIIYREMVHNIDGKPFVSSIPAVLGGHENMTNVAQTSSMYQNVMVVDQFGNTSCMYAAPPVLPKACNAPVYNNSVTQIDKSVPNMVNDFNKTLIIEVGPIVPAPSVNSSEPVPSTSSGSQTDTNVKVNITEKSAEQETKKSGERDTPGSTKGLKILSNIKVEVPVQHHKNMLNTILDLTGPNENDVQVRPISPEKIMPEFEDKQNVSSESAQSSSSTSDGQGSHTFSVIKNIGNPPPSYKESTKTTESKIDNEFSDSCPVPDLICNEKPSISPCSELSEHGENSTDQTSISLKLEPKSQSVTPSSQSSQSESNTETKVRPSFPPQAPRYYSNPLRLNNIFVKKNKKILQIKNAKTQPTTGSNSVSQATPSSSTSKSSENLSVSSVTVNHLEKSGGASMTMTASHDKPGVSSTMTVTHQEKSGVENNNTLQTVSIEKIKDNDRDADDHEEFDADTEEQSMDIEPVPPSSLNSSQFSTSIDIVQVKEEINSSNESGFSNETGNLDRHLTPLETLRPINVITYGNMPPGDFDDDSNHRELLDLEAASKNKQFVNMMNENYFGDNIYADYFTPDRVESFERESAFSKEVQKEGMYMWGEPSQKESEFVLPNFIHESYKIAESNMEYSDVGGGDGGMEGERDGEIDREGCERDSKAEVLSESRSSVGEAPLNICADERMPPRGELSGQESNGDMESPWSNMYTETTAEPYDLMARESWVSDGSDVDPAEKRESLEDELNFKGRSHVCSQCSAKFPCAKELRAHRSVAHALPTCSGAKTSYSRLVTTRTIKKEEKPDDNVMEPPPAYSGPMKIDPLDSKEHIAETMLRVYDAMSSEALGEDGKPKLEALLRRPAKRARRDYVCPTCKVDQVTDAAFHAHLKIHPLECLTCGKCFYRRANLALHIKTHLGIKNYKCEVCEKRFLTRQKLSEHHNVHTGRAPVKCTLCDETFRRYSNMVQHRDRHHFQKKAKVRDFVCVCGAVFHSRARLRWHRETHEPRPKACLYCADKFVHAASLTRHVRRTHHQYILPDAQNKQDNVTCPICKQVYLRQNLRAHIQTHSGKRPFLCIVCNKSFTTKWNLKLHRWTHMNRSAKPFKCSLCKGAFIRQTEYVAHMNSHKSVRPYTCNYCGCQFIRKYNCQRHVREHEMAKKYVCKVPECGKSFHRSYYLSEHMKVHSGARPFSCNICGKTSSNKSNHNKHVKIHHAREPIATEA